MTQSRAAFLWVLTDQGFQGEVAGDLATRSVYATDNSIYELRPDLVVFPKEPEDLEILACAASATDTPITARGGGTGTNGQSLTGAVIVDCSRYLTKIEEINVEEGYAIVQPGVVLDRLNRAAAQHGLFFAPTVSTASRATLGGMAATDASGKGSRLYGRTSDHVLGMDIVLADGQSLSIRDQSPTEFAAADSPLPAPLRAVITDVLRDEADEIARVFPQMNRGLTGYNLDQLGQDGRVSLIKLLCGSEGTLALTKRLKLRLMPRPAHRALVVISYDAMAAALADVARLIPADPAAVEFIDDKILHLAQQDPVWSKIEGALASDSPRPVKGLNFVEVQAASEEALTRAIAGFKALEASAPDSVISSRTLRDPSQIAEIWGLRAKCVGLLGRMDPTRQGTPFVEDAAVPPEALPAFVAGFREILDQRGLAYGMFGHADVGCVHVRPALDLRRPEDAAQIRGISDAVHALAKAHGGLIWGEHGKGFRGEYVPEVFGPRLYAALCRIKAAFDPQNLLNPGKIAAPDPNQALTPLDAIPFRGPLDVRLTPELTEGFEKAVKCNGNAQCMGVDYDSVMCPSYKVSGDRLRSPKGRSALLRDWARRQSVPAADSSGAKRSAEDQALEAQLLSSLSDCLGCRACASQCPVQVDIPQMRHRFYHRYYQSHRRPLRHHLLALMEPLGPLLRALPGPSGLALRLCAPFFDWLGLIDLPEVRPMRVPAPSHAGQAKVMLLTDSFLGSFDGAVPEAALALLAKLGYAAQATKVLDTGKALFSLGMQARYSRVARKTLRQLAKLEKTGATLISLEPAFTDMLRSEYRSLGHPVPKVQTLEQFLAAEIESGLLATRDVAATPGQAALSLFPHCSEAAADPASATRWQSIFGHFGLNVQVQSTGCCGMAGYFGHEAEHLEMSRQLFDMSWRDKIESAAEGATAMATGFSCRCQTKRMTGQRPDHPAQVLAKALT